MPTRREAFDELELDEAEGGAEAFSDEMDEWDEGDEMDETDREWMRDTVTDRLLDSPLASQAHRIADGVGGVDGAAAGAGAAGGQGRQIIASAAQAGFVDGLNEILLVGAVLALVSAAASLLLIRGRDFVDASDPAAPTGDSGDSGDSGAENQSAPGFAQPTHS